ncbi:hypothetical protein P5V15_001231 [Pogonomyrmex californicus]
MISMAVSTCCSRRCRGRRPTDSVRDKVRGWMTARGEISGREGDRLRVGSTVRVQCQGYNQEEEAQLVKTRKIEGSIFELCVESEESVGAVDKSGRRRSEESAQSARGNEKHRVRQRVGIPRERYIYARCMNYYNTIKKACANYRERSYKIVKECASLRKYMYKNMYKYMYMYM